MKFTYIRTCFLFLFYASVVNGQAPTLVNIVKPSPSVQAIQKYGEVPVSNYTGIPEISIPIYTVQFRDITLPISLSYHAGGIKVAEEATEVGLGWVINAGGSVSRNIVGDDDFDGTSYLTNSIPDLDSGLAPQNKVQQGCILALINQKYPTLPTLYNDTLTSVLSGGYPTDWQPDQFYFNIPGKSGKFILRHNGQILLQNQEKVDITYTAGGLSWQIKDLKGNIYDFTKFETYQSTSGSPSQHKSAWHLTQITSATGNKITFNYTALPANFVVPVGSFSERRDAVQLPAVDNSGVAFNAASLGYSYGNAPATNYYQQILSSIDFSVGVVKFNYSGSRTDLVNGIKLDSVSVYAKDASGNMATSPIKTFALFYSYFFGQQYCYIQGMPGLDTQLDPTTARLRLDSVKNIGYFNGQLNVENPYRFNYVQADPNLQPSKMSLARDHWGFFNGKTNNVSLIPSTYSVNSTDYIQAMVGVPGPQRETDTSYAKMFSLYSVTYPTGGSTEFQMESNDYDLAASEVNDHAIFSRLEAASQQTSSTGYDGLNHHMYSDSVMDLSNEYYYPPDGTANSGTPISITVTVRMADPNSTLHQLNNSDLIYFTFFDSKGNAVLSKDLGNLGICDQPNQLACLVDNQGAYSYTYTNLYLPPNIYTVRAYIAPLFGTTIGDFLINVSYLANTAGSPIASQEQGSRNYGFAGGLRVRRIIDHDGINPANDHVRHFIYHYAIGGFEYSYGRRMSRPQYFYFDWVGSSYSETAEGLNTMYTGFNNHLFRSADSNYPLNGSAGGSPVGYDQVTVEDGENGENGKSVFNYYNQPDLVYDFTYYDELPHRPPANSTTAFQLNGSLLHSTIYSNAAGVFYKIKENTNTYNALPARENILYGVENRVTLGDNTYTPTTNCTNILLFYPAITSQWNCLIASDEKTYSNLLDTVNFIDNQIQYAYDNPAHFMPTRTISINSKGDTVTTYTKFGLDYTPAASGDAFNAGILKLNAAHAIDQPVEVYQKRSPSSGAASFVTKGVLTSFSATIPKPTILYDQEIASPNTTFAASSISNGTSTKDGSYVNYISIDQYDSNGNVVQQRKINDIQHAYIYDYANSLPVAEAGNAATSDIAYTSFEFNGNGGWTIGAGTTTAIGGLTGNKYFTLGTGSSITKSGLSSSKKYVVSYWSKNGSLTISGTTATSGLVKRNWTFYQHNLPAGTTSLSISGDGKIIDELRLHPLDAQMKTYTYAPLTGMTTVVDAANLIAYYEYDGLGRLSRIRDIDSNILKQYDYYYQTYTSPGAIWQVTGTLRCKTCPANNAYTTNMQQHQEMDINPASGTYNTSRWIDDGIPGSCVISPSWQNTAAAIRCQQSGSTNDGYQEQQQQDMNPCSSTYGTLQWVTLSLNATACPYCNSSNCSGTNHKCFSTTCQTGTLGIISQTTSGTGANTKCTTLYGYFFSDGSYIYDHTIVNGGICP